MEYSSVSLSSLLCREDEDCLIEKLDEGQENKYINFNPYFVPADSEDESIETLLQKENDTASIATRSCWLDRARLEAITWILNMRQLFKFQFCTAYLSVNFFDRFLSRRSIDDGNLWAIQLLSVACLSLAAKMEECDVPLLAEYPIEGCEFKNSVIQEMELLVLSTLEWEMNSITPFVYFHYFINKLCGDEYKSGVIVSRAGEFVLDLTKEINLFDHPPSTIAAAAVLAAYDDHLTRTSLEVKLSMMISSWGSFENQEHTFSCYSMMQKREITRHCQTPKSVMSPNYSSIHSSFVDVLDDFSFTSASVGTKRRLAFSDDSEQDQPLKKISPQ